MEKIRGAAVQKMGSQMFQEKNDMSRLMFVTELMTCHA